MAQMIKKSQVMQSLRTVMDPELHISIVDLGLIYDVNIVGQKIKILMTLTTPGCPLAPVIDSMVKEAVSRIKGVSLGDISVELEWDPPWTREMMSEEGRAQLGMI